MKKQVKTQKGIVGTVVSRSSDNTVIVEVTRIWHHPVYKKAVHRSIRIPAHIENMEVSVGQMVRLVPTRPLSKTKHYKVIGNL